MVTLSTLHKTKLLQQIKLCFEQTINWNKYKSGIRNQAGNNNLNYLIDSMFQKVNTLFLISFKIQTVEYHIQIIMYQKVK